MKYTLAQKAQVMALQNSNTVRAHEYENVFLVTDGYIGYYINKKEWYLDISKLRDFDGKEDTIDPDLLFKNTLPARKTRRVHLIPGGKMAVMLKTEEGITAWVNLDYVKKFGDGVGFRISTERDPVYVCNYKNEPLGIILPMRISEDELLK